MRLTRSSGRPVWVNPLLVRTAEPDTWVDMAGQDRTPQNGTLLVFDGHWEDDPEADSAGDGDFRDSVAVREPWEQVFVELDQALIAIHGGGQFGWTNVVHFGETA